MTLATHVRHYRQLHGWTQAELAEKIGRKRLMITRLESGQCQPQYEALTRLADVFGMSISQLQQGPGHAALNAQYFRMRKSLSIEGMADAIGVAPVTLRRVEAGITSGLESDAIRALARKAKVPVSRFRTENMRCLIDAGIIVDV